MDLDFERCYRAVDSRDPRFDGWFFTAVTSTGIYCRPSCPATTPRRENVRFYPSAAAAQRGGFRACRRCRPDAAPGSPDWDARADAVGRAMRLIGDGVVDREGVPGLARRVGYTERHLHRMLAAEVGAGPLALARAQRAQTARILIETTALGLADIAFAAGFGSVRQFNETIQQVFGGSPSQLRELRRQRTGWLLPGPVVTAGPGVVHLRLAYRAPLHTSALLGFLAARAIPGVEEADETTYRRALSLPHGPATAALTPQDGYVAATLHVADLRDLAPAVARCRRLLDLDADPDAIDGTLDADPFLSAMIADEPGVRVPRAVDGFEMAVRAVVGQQISVAAARSVLSRLVRATAVHRATHADAAPPPPATTGAFPPGDVPAEATEWRLAAHATSVDLPDRWAGAVDPADARVAAVDPADARGPADKPAAARVAAVRSAVDGEAAGQLAASRGDDAQAKTDARPAAHPTTAGRWTANRDGDAQATTDTQPAAHATTAGRPTANRDGDAQATTDTRTAADATTARQSTTSRDGTAETATDTQPAAGAATAGRSTASRDSRADGGPGWSVAGGGLMPFPTPEELLELPDEAFGMPAARRETLRALARAVADGLTLDPGADREEITARLTALPGIGGWTAGYVALRALGDPDVLLPTDLAVRKGARALGLPHTPAALAAHAERWRPWRSYALIRLWRAAARE